MVSDPCILRVLLSVEQNVVDSDLARCIQQLEPEG